MDEFRRQIRSLGHPQVGAHAQGLTVAALQHGESQAMGAGDLGRRLGEGLRGAMVGRGGHELTGQLHPGAHRIHCRQALFGPRGQAQQGAGLRGEFGLFLTAKAMVAVEGQPGGFAHGFGCRLRLQALHRQEHPQMLHAEAGRGPHARRRGRPQGRQIKAGRLPQTHQGEVAGHGAGPIEAHAFAGFAPKAPALQGFPTGVPQECAQQGAGRMLLPLEESQHQAITRPPLQGSGWATVFSKGRERQAADVHGPGRRPGS